MPTRVRVQAAPEQPETPSWVIEITPRPGGRSEWYEFIHPERAAEIILGRLETRFFTPTPPDTKQLITMRKPLSGKGWRIQRSMVNYDEFIRRALS